MDHTKPSRLPPAAVKWLPILATLQRDPRSLRIGVSRESGALTYTVVAIDGKGKPLPLAWGDRIPAALRMALPVVAYADTGMLPVHIVCKDIGTEDPDAWIDRHEADVLPAGFTADRIVTEYSVTGATITAVSAVATDLAALISESEKSMTLATLYTPLHGLATAYRQEFDGPVVIWKIDDGGSVIGRVQDGAVTALCHCYLDREDLIKDTDSAGAEAFRLIRSVAGSDTPLRCIVFPPDAAGLVASRFPSGKITIVPQPQTGLLPVRFHAAFGNALPVKGEALSLLPFHKRKRAETVRRAFTASVSVCRYLFAALVVAGFTGAGYIGVSRLFIERDREAMVKIDKQYAAVMAAVARRDSLLGEINRKNAFITGESAITRLLNDLQEVFPEGAKAEEISILERNEDSWRLVVRAYAKSSSLIQPLIGNVQKIKGIRDVRMIYSEQAPEKKADGGIVFKIEAHWR
jgi:nitrate reductase NapAB chaperone NapD